MPAQVLHTGGPRYFYKMVALGPLYASACTKWWPLGLSKALPVQNGGPWGCVTRLVGGSCWDACVALLLPGQSKIFLSSLCGHLVASSRCLIWLGGFSWLLQAEVPKNHESSLYKMVAPGALPGSACTKWWPLRVCVTRLVDRFCFFQPWDGLCSFAAARPVQDLPVYLVWPLGRIFQVFGLQAELPQKKTKAACTKWWPLALCEAVPVQNRGNWGCVTRLVGGFCLCCRQANARFSLYLV